MNQEEDTSSAHHSSLDPEDPRRVDIPVYLDTGVALSLAASLNRGLVMESSVETAFSSDRAGSVRARTSLLPFASLSAQADGSRSDAVTASEVRRQTQESIFNSVRSALETNRLLRRPAAPWNDAQWSVGDFVDFSSAHITVPLVPALGRARGIVDSFAFVARALSVDGLQRQIPQILEQLRGETKDRPVNDDSKGFDYVLSLLTEIGEVARALAGVFERLEEEAEASGLVDVVMFDSRFEPSSVIAVASLDREYVDAKLLRRLSQGQFGVLGKVIRPPEEATAFNAYRNSLLGATNQLPVLLSRLHQRLLELPRFVGDGVYLGEESEGALLNFVGSASAITDLAPLWAFPSIEIFPVAIYA